MNQDGLKGLPRWTMRGNVQASMVVGWKAHEKHRNLYIMDLQHGVAIVDRDWIQSRGVHTGGYLVLRESGCIEFVSAAEFEALYQPAVPDQATVAPTGSPAASVRDSYPMGLCPDCALEIPEDAAEGYACTNCGHACYSTQEGTSASTLHAQYHDKARAATDALPGEDEVVFERDAIRFNALRIAAHHKAVCPGPDCQISLFLLRRALELAGIPLTAEEWRAFV